MGTILTRCEYDATKKCVIGAYWFCRDCEKYPSIDKSKQFQRLHGKKETDCIFCAIVGATPNTFITGHHVIPNGIANNHLQHKIGVKVPMCFNHHKLFHALLEPYDDILRSKSEPYQSRKQLTDYFIYMKLPELMTRIKTMINEAYQK